MPPITLPPRSPATLRAFWIVLSSAFGLMAGTGAAIVKSDRRWLTLVFPVAGLTALPGLLKPLWVELPYRAWNKAGRHVGLWASDQVSRAAYGVVRDGREVGELPQVHQRSPGTSGWSARSSQSRATYRYQDAVDADIGRDPFDRFARQPGNRWVEPLRPLVAIMRALETDAAVDDTPPADTYTLY